MANATHCQWSHQVEGPHHEKPEIIRNKNVFHIWRELKLLYKFFLSTVVGYTTSRIEHYDLPGLAVAELQGTDAPEIKYPPQVATSIPEILPCPERYYIPKTLENWKWPRRINPHHNEVQAATAAWIRSSGALSPKAHKAYDRCNINLFGSLSYPLHDKARLRTCCDFMNLILVYDEFPNASHEDEVQVMTNAIMDAVRDPHTARPKGEWVGGEVTRQFWELAIKSASPQAQKRFIKASGAYAQAVVQQAADRRHKHVRSAQGLRNFEASGADRLSAGRRILLNVEQARGDDGYNIITVVMHQHKTNIQGAMNWELEAKFMDPYENKIPKFGEPVDTELARYVDGIGNWVRANDQWDFETERYFGKKALEVGRTRWVTLLPKERQKYIGTLLVNGSLS
ncbi:terpenoid synthase [Lactarius hatsudake]|nr:terpenoid synthase [Lactarius hatsudake]